MPELVGRTDEVAALTEVLDQVEAGWTAALVLEGVAGVGKSRLLDHVAVIADERDWTVVRAAGTEFEQEMAFTGLASIVGLHLDVVDRLDLRYANALRAALALDDGSTPQLAVSVALLSFLATLADQQPLLVLVDDVHWLDEASATALHFAVHRLGADRVAVLMASRPESRPAVARALPTVPVDELRSDEIVALLQPLDVSREVAHRCEAAVGGNPLGLLELARRLSRDQRAGLAELPDPLPLAARLADAFRPLLDALSEPTRQALEIAAVAGTTELVAIRSALPMVGLDDSELVIAEEAGLIELGHRALQWTHPLAKAAVQNSMSRRTRREAHRVLAEVLDPSRAADQIAWHFAAAATGPDEETAARLEAVGEDARRRGALGAAAQAFDRAAQLSEDDETRAERLIAMGRALWAGGTSMASVDRMHDAMSQTIDPIARARIAVVLGQAEVWSTGIDAAVRLLDEHARVVCDLDPALSAELGVQAAGALIVAGDVTRALVRATNAEEAAQRSGRPATLFATGLVRAVARLLAGEPGATEAIEPVVALTLALLPSGEAGIEMAAQLAGFSSCVIEQWQPTEDLLAGVIGIGEEMGMLGLMAVATVIRADARFRVGRWTEALADLSNVVTMADATDERVIGDFASGCLARVEAGRGMEQRCREHARAALDTASTLGIGSAALWARHALAVLELGAGRPEVALEHLDAIAIEVAEFGLDDPGALWWRPDHVSALLVCGRRDEAVAVADGLRARTERTGRGYGVAATAWCDAMLMAPSGDPEPMVTIAAERFEVIGAPFERARVLLDRGRMRLRHSHGVSVPGKRDIAEAQSVFDRLGARAWGGQARSVSGDTAEDPALNLAGLLTPAELRVAMCVGSGASNKGASDQLFVSVKTVDYHLQNIYRKLEIRSRTQLAAVVAEDRVPG